MKNTDLHDAIGEIDESIIADVAEKRSARKKPRLTTILKYASVAACVCVVVLGAVLLGLSPMMDDEPPVNIPAGDTIGTLDDDSTVSELKPSNTEPTESETFSDRDESSDSAGTLPSESSQIKPQEINKDTTDNKAEHPINMSSTELTAGFVSDLLNFNKVSPADYSISIADFSFDLFRQTLKGEGNEMISPLSALYALTMCANSVEGESLRQIENAVGMSRDEMNNFVRSYMDSLPSGRGYSLKCANSVWLRDSESLSVSDEYLRNVKEYLSAQVYTSPFDQTSVDDINKWVKLNTDGMIDNLIDSIDSDTYTYLMNTIAFDAEWKTPLIALPEKVFILENGTRISCNSFMHGDTTDGYLEDDNTTGFIVEYRGNFDIESYTIKDSYAFVLLLPNEGITIRDYINSLSGEKIHSLLQNKKLLNVAFDFPAFESSYKESLKDAFNSLGIYDIFEPSKITQTAFKVSGNPIYYSEAIQKTYIEVNTGGTKAASVTAIIGAPTSTTPVQNDKHINVKRPFVYMIVDCENGIPLFLGTVMDPTN